MSFEWKDRYSFGMASIDKQHKKLFEIGAQASDLAGRNDAYDHYDEIMGVINELLEYTEYHFKFEENLMKEYGFDGLEKQAQEHSFYVSKIRSICSKDIDNDQQKTTTEIVDFLSDWISSHILFSDRNYATFFKTKGII